MENINILKKLYKNQLIRSKTRNIEWKFTFDTWLKWWRETGVLNLRGRGKNKYCMCRYNDVGPYSIDNVYLDTHGNNVMDAFGLHFEYNGVKYRSLREFSRKNNIPKSTVIYRNNYNLDLITGNKI